MRLKLFYITEHGLNSFSKLAHESSIKLDYASAIPSLLEIVL